MSSSDSIKWDWGSETKEFNLWERLKMKSIRSLSWHRSKTISFFTICPKKRSTMSRNTCFGLKLQKEPSSFDRAVEAPASTSSNTAQSKLKWKSKPQKSSKQARDSVNLLFCTKSIGLQQPRLNKNAVSGSLIESASDRPFKKSSSVNFKPIRSFWKVWLSTSSWNLNKSKK